MRKICGFVVGHALAVALVVANKFVLHFGSWFLSLFLKKK